MVVGFWFENVTKTVFRRGEGTEKTDPADRILGVTKTVYTNNRAERKIW